MVPTSDSTYHGIYLARLDLGVKNHLGILSKIAGQRTALEMALGPVTTYFANGLSVEQDGKAISTYHAGLAASQRFHQYGFYRLLKQQNLQADYFYIRYQLCNPAFLFFLKSLRSQNPSAPIFVEIPTYPYDLQQAGLSQKIGHSQKIKLLQDRLTRNQMASMIDNIVTFSRSDDIFGVPTIKTENGIALDQFPVIPAAEFNGQLNLVGVANVSHWHGYDRVIKGLHSYYSSERPTNVHFTIIGEGAAIPDLKQLVGELGLEHCVTFLGARMGQDLTGALKGQHLGVSCLGTHRVSSDTTALKSREYCARGLPFLTSHDETDIPDHFPYALKLSNDDTSVDIEAALNFFKKLRAEHPSYATDLRTYAAGNLTWYSKMVPVVDRIRQLIDANRGKSGRP